MQATKIRKKLREALDRRNMSPTAAANEIGSAPMTILGFLENTRKIQDRTLFKIEQWCNGDAKQTKTFPNRQPVLVEPIKRGFDENDVRDALELLRNKSVSDGAARRFAERALSGFFQ